jgi:hypothetical protein
VAGGSPQRHLQVGHKFIGHPKTDRLQDLRFGLDMIVQTGGFHTHMLGKVAHAGGAKTFLPEKLREAFSMITSFLVLFFLL